MFQGAPLATQLKSFDKQWVYNFKFIYEIFDEIKQPQNEQAGQQDFPGELSEEIGKGIRYLELFIAGIKNLNHYYNLRIKEKFEF